MNNIKLKRYMLIGGNPFCDVMTKTPTFTGLNVMGYADTDNEVEKLTKEKYDKCGGLMIWIDTDKRCEGEPKFNVVLKHLDETPMFTAKEAKALVDESQKNDDDIFLKDFLNSIKTIAEDGISEYTLNHKINDSVRTQLFELEFNLETNYKRDDEEYTIVSW